MKKFVLLLLIAGPGFNGFSQSNALQAPRLETAGLADIDLQTKFTNFIVQSHSQFAKGQLNEFTGLGGTQRYFSNVWVVGTATNPNDVVFGKPFVFNFDFKEHELYAQWKDTAIVVNSNYLKSFMLMENGQAHYFVRAPSIHIKYFFESIGYDSELRTDRIQLLKLRKVIYKKTNKNDYTAAFNGDYSDKQVNEIDYYLLMPDDTYKKVKLTKKSLSAALIQYKTKVDQFFETTETLNEITAAALIIFLNR